MTFYMKCKVKGDKGEIALKIDISKADDSVDWGFLRVMMVKLGFRGQMISARLTNHVLCEFGQLLSVD